MQKQSESRTKILPALCSEAQLSSLLWNSPACMVIPGAFYCGEATSVCAVSCNVCSETRIASKPRCSVSVCIDGWPTTEPPASIRLLLQPSLTEKSCSFLSPWSPPAVLCLEPIRGSFCHVSQQNQWDDPRRLFWMSVPLSLGSGTPALCLLAPGPHSATLGRDHSRVRPGRWRPVTSPHKNALLLRKWKLSEVWELNGVIGVCFNHSLVVAAESSPC